MLVLARHKGEGVWVDGVRVVIVEIRGDKVRLGFEGPPEVPILRDEVRDAMLQESGGPVSLAKELQSPTEPPSAPAA